MDAPQPPPSPASPALGIGRGERMAMEEIGLTRIRRAHAVVFVGLFLAFLYGVLLWDLPVLCRLPGIAGAVTPDPPTTTIHKSSMLPDWSRHVFAQNQQLLDWIKATERQVDEHSPFARAMRPGVQDFLAACGEGGTEVMAGRDGWLFYRPSFRFLTRRAEDLTTIGTPPGRADLSATTGYRASLAAITGFAEALRGRGIRLVVVPVWPKQSIQPEQLGGLPYRSNEALKPASFAAWRTALETSGVDVFDPAATLMAAKNANGGKAYLKTDSHWTPAAMQACAAGLARYLTDSGLVTPGTAPATMVRSTVTNQGDLARMLQLPAGSRRFPPEPIEIAGVRGDKGLRWLANRASPVLLLGDSFSNIFSLAGMGWGQDAGFAEHLGAALAMPVDAILRNGDGESATRALLARELATGRDRLAGKKVLVWEFSATQLTEGRWLSFNYNPGTPPPADTRFVEMADEESRQVTATVTELGPVPHPGTTVYNEYVDYLVLDDLQPVTGPALSGTRAVVYALVMKDHQWTPPASLRPGQHIRATLRSWTSAENEFSRHQRCEPPASLILQPVNWLQDLTIED